MSLLSLRKFALVSHRPTFRKALSSLRINHCLSQNNLIIVSRMIMIAIRSRKGIGVGLGEGCEAVTLEE